MARKWIQAVLSKGRPGALRARLREAHLIPKGDKPIPVKVLDKAASGMLGRVTKKRAILAKTLRRLRKG